jgi:hypothetical protein
MMDRKVFAMVAIAFASIFGCVGAPVEPPDPGPCCADDGNPCTSQACVDGVCKTSWTTPGAACGDDQPGFCDSDGACREECPREACFDAVVQEGLGCVYAKRLDGWTCNLVDGVPQGVCREGVCCTGCWAGSWCSPTPNEYACGRNGNLCTPCNGAELCVDGACVLGDY